MSNLKLRVELNKGRVGIPLSKFGNIIKKTQQFLAAAGEDIGLDGDPKDWGADNFKNGSVDFDCRRMDSQPPNIINYGNQILRHIMKNDHSDPEMNLKIRPITRLQYARIADSIAHDEIVSFGLYQNGAEAPSEWFELTKESALEIIEEKPQFITYYGQIQGIIHALYKESTPSKLIFREQATGALIDCLFGPDLYQTVIDILRKRDAVIFVEGKVTEDQAEGQVKSIEVAKFQPAPDFDEDQIKRFIGSQPNYTGKLTTEEFIDKVRNNE